MIDPAEVPHKESFQENPQSPLNVNIAAYESAMMLLNIRHKVKENWTESEAEAVRTFFKSLANPFKADTSS